MIPFLVGIGAALWIGSSMSDNKKPIEEKVTREIDESDVPPDVRALIEQQEKDLQSPQKVCKEGKRKKPQQLSSDKQIEQWLKMGYSFYYGDNGKKVNRFEAEKYFHKATKAGSSEAKEMLKIMHGARNREIDENNIPPWARVLIEQQDQDLQHSHVKPIKRTVESSESSDNVVYWLKTGYALLYGRNGARKTPEKARHWFEMAAEAGNEEALAVLADKFN